MNRFKIIKGCQVPDVPWMTEKHTEEILDYVPHDDDIIIASYPRTGTNWLNYIVLQIISKGELFPSFNDTRLKYGPFLQLTGLSVLNEMGSPRLYKYHFRYDMVQRNNKAKYLYIYRKPEDTFISGFHFMLSYFEKPHKNLDEFFEDFVSGNVMFGNYFDHVLSYIAHKDDENLLLISYETLLRNRKEEILRIAKFLGEEYFQNLSEDDLLMENILERTSFVYMKKNLFFAHPGSRSEDEKPENVPMFRKGVIGDGKKSLSSDQLKRLKDMVIERMAGTSLIAEWVDE